MRELESIFCKLNPIWVAKGHMTRKSSEEFVAAVEKRMNLLLTAPDKKENRRWDCSNILSEAARRLCLNSGGKRVRPKLILLLGEALGVGYTALEAIAVTAELIHAASLLHDDVVDEAALRRGLATANNQFGNSVAVLAGDWLLSNAFTSLDNLPRQITTDALHVVAEMSRAAILEVEARGQIDLTIDDWYTIAAGKTGALFGWCGKSVARLSERADMVPALDTFGRRLGLAFQLADDLKDLVEKESGKDRFCDIKNRSPSLPIIWATKQSADLYSQLSLAWSKPTMEPEEVQQLGNLLIAHGADTMAVTELENEVSQAVACLQPLGDLPWIDKIANLAQSFAPKS